MTIFDVARVPVALRRHSAAPMPSDVVRVAGPTAAENVAESLQRGMRVIVTGRLKLRNYETKEGEKRTVYEVEVDDVGPSPRNASAKVTRAERRGQGGFSGGSGGQSSSGGSRTQDPQASDAGHSNEPPF